MQRVHGWTATAFAVLFIAACGGTMHATLTGAISVADQKTVLQQFYSSLQGKTWAINTNWTSTSDYCDWFGVACDTAQNVVSISLPNNNLQGELPAQLSLLTLLSNLVVPGNHIVGGIDFVTRMPQLVYLDVTSNMLTGAIPELSNLTQCGELHLGQNHFSGSIPSSVTKMHNLGAIYLYTNELTGEIPSGLLSLPHLNTVWMAYNKLSGTIPDEFSQAMSKIDLSHNEFTGPFPKTIASLPRLQYLDMSYNRLKGNVTNEAIKMHAIDKCILAHNDLNCPLPTLPLVCEQDYFPQGNCSYGLPPAPLM